jgi:YVTN family beta-propeller protein
MKPALATCAGRLQGVLALLGLCFAAVAAEPQTQRQEAAGVAVSLRFVQSADGVGQAEIALSDAASGQALGGARPAAWMLARRSEAVASERSCDDKAAMLMAGSLGARADVDLNGYRLVTLNQDNTLAFINPHVGLRSSKLESIVQLPGTGHDWVLAQRAQRLFISLREQDAVAVVDMATRRLLHTVPTGAGSLPTRLAVDEAGQRVWVGLDGLDEVLALDVGSGQTPARVRARVPVGQGLHTLGLLAPELPWLYVTHSQSDDLTLIDRNTLQAVARVAVGQTPVAAAWSAAAQRLAVLSLNAGELSLVDPVTAQVSARLTLQRGVVELGLFDDGRRALVLNARSAQLSLLDLATASVVAHMPVPAQPDQLAFSREFAYLRSQSTPNVQVINLAQARQGRLQAVAVPMGRSSPADAPQAINVAGVFAPAPEGNGMLVANPSDATLYRYAEGMMMPVGSFSNYRRQARALRVLDASLAEHAPGQFEAAVRVERGGRYDLVVRNLRPSVTACFVVEAQGVAAPAGAPAAPQPRLLSLRQGEPGEALLDFELRDATGQAVDAADAQVLAVQVHGTRQLRATVRSLGQGRHSARLQGLQPGPFEWLLQAPALGLGYEQGRLGRLNWPPAPEATPPASTSASTSAKAASPPPSLAAAVVPLAGALPELRP